MRRAVRPLACSIAAAALAACAAPPPPPAPAPALVGVEVLRGVPAPAPAPEQARVALVIDASASMGGAAAEGVTRLAAAQIRAEELLDALPAGALLSIDAAGSECGTTARVASPTRDAGAARAAVRSLSARGEGSLAEALQSVARDLAAEGSLDGARIVAFGDLDDRCGGDLCAAVRSVAASGASLDLVVLGGRSTPDCVAEASAGPASPPAGLVQPPAPAFEVRPGAGPAVIGTAGATPVRVPAGAASVTIGLDPPIEIGPLTLEPGAVLRIRVVDFPGLSPPVRDWTVDVLGAGAELAGAPAPTALPHP